MKYLKNRMVIDTELPEIHCYSCVDYSLSILNPIDHKFKSFKILDINEHL